jgi:ribosomal protein L12E/L44/L45/RPP1/RPP2
MFKGSQGNMNASTSASANEGSFFDSLDMENPKSFSNPLVQMPKGHEQYTEADKDKCPVMSGKVKPPTQEEKQEDEEEYSSGSSDEEEEQTEMPTGHEGYSEKDKDKCPVMSGKIKNPQAADEQAEGQKKKKKKKIQSGCPFMPTESKKPPSLAHLEPSFEIPYISTLRHLFTFRGILSKNHSSNENKEKFDTYPYFLKHTLFHNEEKFEKIRKLEVAHRFFVYDKFREQGNKKYNRNKPAEAISLYEHALSCFKWLEVKKEEKKDEEEKKEEGEEGEVPEDHLESLKPMNKALYSILSDDNVVLRDGEELTDQNEIDMRTSMLLNVYLALSCAYLRLNHYGEAIKAIEEGMKLNHANSQLYFRRSQARAYNKGSSLEDLYKAKEDIEKAIEIKHYEKLFQQEPGILKILNVHNAGEIYVEHAHYVEKVIKEKKEDFKSNVRFFFQRIKDIEQHEEQILKEGIIPYENDNENAVDIKDEDNMEFDIIREMATKYFKIIEFYLETEKKDQVSIARKEVQTVLDAYTKMKLYMGLDFKNYEKDPLIMEVLKEFDIDMTKPKVQKRLERLRIAKIKEIFENGKFNLEVLQYAIKDYFKRKEEEEKKKKEKEKEEQETEKPKRSWLRQLFGVEFGLQIMIVFLLFGLFWYFNKNSLFGSTPMGNKN